MGDIVMKDVSHLTPEEREEFERVKAEKIKIFVEWNAKIALRRLAMEKEKGKKGVQIKSS